MNNIDEKYSIPVREIQNQLIELGFKELGSGWFGSKFDDIRIRFWRDHEVDFWFWRSPVNTDNNQIHFRGKIYSIDDIKWVLERCFNVV